MASKTKTKPASPIMGYDDAPEPLEVGESPGGSAAPPREVWIDLLDDAECDFAVAARGVAALTTPSAELPCFPHPSLQFPRRCWHRPFGGTRAIGTGGTSPGRLASFAGFGCQTVDTSAAVWCSV
jgi:hypothetical protein